ncbi:hypothetical protein LOAG_04159 [Loa loa]|uniref:Uncharacterized protein n=1 Tax=Loa loa TaxID=7209 RepID=A0A1S0U2M4_LOALO|nr:hypothetical protein LOAG_04159 [Loa loa]EFO24326.1 hypothetical protein LOAG_04159 [Loa loa]
MSRNSICESVIHGDSQITLEANLFQIYDVIECKCKYPPDEPISRPSTRSVVYPPCTISSSPFVSAIFCSHFVAQYFQRVNVHCAQFIITDAVPIFYFLSFRNWQ